MGERRSSRLAAQNSSPTSSQENVGEKRKAGSDTASPSSTKRGKKDKDQKTLEDTGIATKEDTPAKKKDVKEDEVMEDAPESNGHHDEEKAEAEAKKTEESVKEPESKEEKSSDNKTEDEKPSNSESKEEKPSSFETAGDKSEKAETEATGGANSTAIEHSKKREEKIPSNILEKGLIYFFTRGRVGIDEPESVQDLARTHFVLRPLAHGAKLTDGPAQDMGGNRLVALPKKVLPKSPRDRFITFVEKGKTTIKDLKDTFFPSSDYETKTTGVRHTPAATPIAEGIYSITKTGRDTHLVYILTIPQELGQVQKSMGVAEKGSFVISLKNPEVGGSGQPGLPQPPSYPKEIQEEFRGLRWMPAQPHHLDIDGSVVLLIGEGLGEFKGATETADKDKEDDNKITVEEEMYQLEHEDEERVKKLHGDDSIFDDLKLSKKENPSVMTTW